MMSQSPKAPFRLIADYVVPGDGTAAVIKDGAVDIDSEGRIAAVGPATSLGEPTGDVADVGGLLMPGLVNAHAHGPMTLVRSAGDGLPLMRWLQEGVWPREGKMTPDDAYVGMQLASCEMLLSGVTTSVEMYLFEDAVAKAVSETGGRVAVMAGIISAIAPDDAAFAGRLEAVSKFCAAHGGDGRVTAGLGPHSVYDLGPDRLGLVAQAAEATGAPVHIHLEETQAERQLVLDAHGRSATQVLADSGVLDGDVSAAHGVWLDESDLAILADADAALVHCPMSNLKLGSGIADLAAWRSAGLRIGLGSDGVASNDNLDMWEDLRLGPLLARGSAHDPGSFSASDALAIATTGGGSTSGLSDIGELRAGAWADVVRIDLNHPAFFPGVEQDRFANLVWAGSGRHVSDVWVAGRQVVASGEMTMVDRTGIQAAAAEAGARIAAD